MTAKIKVAAIDLFVPAGTQPTDNFSAFDSDLGWVYLHKIEVRIPPGHNGRTGLSIVSNGLSIVPWNSEDSFLTGSDESLSFPYEDTIDTQISAICYNLGAYNHFFYTRFFYTPISLITEAKSVAAIVPIA